MVIVMIKILETVHHRKLKKTPHSFG